jgi:hypothetical protein
MRSAFRLSLAIIFAAPVQADVYVYQTDAGGSFHLAGGTLKDLLPPIREWLRSVKADPTEGRVGSDGSISVYSRLGDGAVVVNGDRECISFGVQVVALDDSQPDAVNLVGSFREMLRGRFADRVKLFADRECAHVL